MLTDWASIRRARFISVTGRRWRFGVMARRGVMAEHKGRAQCRGARRMGTVLENRGAISGCKR
jgi:hypothetical protein